MGLRSIDVTSQPKEIQLAAHAIGLGNKNPYKRHGKLFYAPYRNYFVTSSESDDYVNWEKLVSHGYAKVSCRDGHYTFWLTRSGLDWLGEQLEIKIYDEEV